MVPSATSVALMAFIACAWAAPQKLDYELPAGNVRFDRQFNNQAKLQGRQVVSYAQPTVTYSQPKVSYAQPTVTYSQPKVSYAQPAVTYSQPKVYAQPTQVSHIHPVAQVQQPVYTNVQASPVTYTNSIARQDVQRPIAIVRLVQDNNFDGTFNYDFEGENGIKSEARGLLKNVPGSDQPAQVMSGSYSYIAPDGTPIVTNWYADETGFHAEGNHLPVAPPVPVEIQRSLEYLRSLPPNPEDLKYN